MSRLDPAADLDKLLHLVRDYRLDLHDPALVSELAALNPARLRAPDARRLVGIKERLQPYLDYHEHNPYVTAPAGVFAGAYVLGHQRANKLPINASDDDLLRHTGIYGGSGSGKTTALRRLVNQALEHDKHIVLLDPKDDSLALAVHDERFLLLSPHARLNLIQQPDFLSQDEFITIFCDIFCKTWYAAENQKQVLSEALTAAYADHEAPSLHDVTARIKASHSKKLTFSRRDAITGAANRLERFGRTFPGLSSTRHGITWSTLFQHSIYLNTLLGDEQTTFLYSLLVTLLFLHHRRRNIRNELTHVLVNDEGNSFWAAAQNDIVRAPTLINLQGLIREFGLALMHTSVDLSSLHPILKSNTYTSIALNVTGGRETGELKRHFALSTAQVEYAQKRLRKGECLIRFGDGWRDTILATYPALPIEKTVTATERAAAEARINQYAPPELPATIQTQEPPPAQGHIPPNSQASLPEAQPPTEHQPDDPAPTAPSSPTTTRQLAHPTPTTAPQPVPADDTLPLLSDEERRPPLKISVNEERLLRTATEKLWIATQAYEAAALSRSAGQSSKDHLVTLGLLETHRILVKAGRGGNALAISPTAAGYELLGRKRPKGTKGGDGAQHRWLIQGFAACIPGAQVEVAIGGKSVDLLAVYDPQLHLPAVFYMENNELQPGAHLALEVETSAPARTALNNITNNAQAGVAFTIVAVLPKHVARTTASLAERVPHDLQDAYTVVDVFELLEGLRR